MELLREIRADNPSPMTLEGTRTFVVGRTRPVVIDPGPDDAAHLAALEAVLDGARPAAILLTHGHADHAAGAGALAGRTGAEVWMARGSLQPIPSGLVSRWIADGATVETDAGPVRAVATPGHVPEHLAFWWSGPAAPPGGALFVGDLLMGTGDTTLVSPPEGDLAAYLRSLDRVAELAPGVLIPAHGPPLLDPDEAIRRYRAHRRERIEQVRAALRASPAATPRQVVDLVYGSDLHPGLRAAAAGSVEAILKFLSSVPD